MRKLRLVQLGVAGALLAATVPAATAQADTASSTTYKVWQWNAAGNTLHGGRTDTGMVTSAVSSIVNRNPDFVAFNELCKDQFDALVTKLAATGWNVDDTNFARFEPSLPAGSGVCGPKDGAYGNALFSKQPLGVASRTILTDDGTAEKRNLLCAPLQNAASGVRFCVTHLTTVNDLKYRQIGDVLAKLEAWNAAGEKVLLAGDLNVQPHYKAMDDVYSASVNVPTVNDGNTGAYRELDDNDGTTTGSCLGYGEPTSNNPAGTAKNACDPALNPKLDFLLVRESALAEPHAYSADALTTSTSCTIGLCSDHRILVGDVTLK
ncbi:endonuclease/exonuclease/phosphatase family protein [Streptomyces sp. NPDC047972]|uniref:endonuclease/exonuclease/phosphatase family protein n=1 Tax=Streptomyces sp. NPDC047972 TaxID=3365493 RepID=UPI00372348C5